MCAQVLVLSAQSLFTPEETRSQRQRYSAPSIAALRACGLCGATHIEFAWMFWCPHLLFAPCSAYCLFSCCCGAQHRVCGDRGREQEFRHRACTPLRGGPGVELRCRVCVSPQHPVSASTPGISRGAWSCVSGSNFPLILRSHSIGFTGAQGVHQYKIGLGRGKDGRVVVGLVAACSASCGISLPFQ